MVKGIDIARAGVPADESTGELVASLVREEASPGVAKQAAPSAARPARPARLLLALHGDRSPERALRFADSLARSLAAELHVLRVVRPIARAAGASDPLVIAVREAQRVLAAARRTRALCDTVLLQSLPSPRLCVRLGAFVEQVALRATELEATIIAVPETKSPLAATVIRIAQRADLPVIVARGRADFHTLLAATDLEDSQVPLLQKAAQLGRDLEASVVAVHGVLDTTEHNPGADSLQEGAHTLEMVTRFFDAPFERVVVRSRDPVSCIIEQASARNASLVLVCERLEQSSGPPGCGSLPR